VLPNEGRDEKVIVIGEDDVGLCLFFIECLTIMSDYEKVVLATMVTSLEMEILSTSIPFTQSLGRSVLLLTVDKYHF
jgi:hypothetical protein